MNKTHLIKELQEMDEQLGNLIEKLAGRSFKEPGTLQCSGRRNGTSFYRVDGEAKTYLGKDDHDVVVTLANKLFTEKMLGAAKAEKGQIEKCLKTLNSGRAIADIDEVFPSLHQAVQKLVSPIEDDDEKYAKAWYNKYKSFANRNKELNSPLKTARGETVKSKSEIIIADRLDRAGIPYIYEISFSFVEYRMRYPDVFILNKRTRKEYVWEHQGKMDDKKYCLDSQLKLEQFAKNGYLLGKNLIFTYEGSERSLSTEYVDELIKQFLI